MALKTKVSKADFDALEESLKAHYVADGENYKLDADYEDVTGLKNKNGELLGELAKFKETFKDIDPEAARKAIAELEAARREKMTADELYKEDIKKYKTQLDEANQRSRALFETQAERDLHLTLANKKVRAEKIEDAAIVLRAKHLKAEEADGKPVWKSLSGESLDLNEYLEGLRSSKADWFEPTTQTGGGASGSGSNSGSSAQWTRQDWDAASTQQRTAFTESGGKVTT